MENDIEKNNKSKLIIYVMLGIIILVIIVLLWPSKNNESKTSNKILDVRAPETMLVGESSTISVSTDDPNIRVIYKYGYISSPSISYPGGNNVAIPITANKEGTEEVEIKTSSLVKNVFINICGEIKLSTSSISLNAGLNKKLDLSVSGSCLLKYDIKVQDESIATYSNGTIYGKTPGLTVLTITNGSKVTRLNIKVNSNEISFDQSISSLKVGETKELEVVGTDENITCKASNSNATVVSTDDGCSVTGKKVGDVTITATAGALETSANIKVIEPVVSVSGVSINTGAVRVAKGGTYKLNATITPNDATDKKLTWSSSDNRIVNVAADGTVTGTSIGMAKIIAKTSNGKIATANVAVTDSNMIASYESGTLKYWITKGGTYYDTTYIWVKDAYSQFKMAITEPKNASSPTPRYAQRAEKIVDYLLKTNPSYSSKGFVIINASAMVSSQFGKSAPSNWFGTSQIPLILHDGKVIRDSSNEQLHIDGDYFIYGMTKDGDLTYYKYNRSGATASDKQYNKELFQKIRNDGVLNTFGFSPVLVWNGQVMSSSNTPNIRQAICQVDKNSFILVTNTNSTGNRDAGFGYKGLGEYFQKLGCKTALNLDGGGSTCLFYKKPGSNYVKVDTTYGSRELSDMIYFVEK